MKHLTEDQVREFDERGYLLLPQWVPTDFVARVCKAAESTLDQLVQGPLDGPNTGDLCVTYKDDTPFIGAIIHPHKYLYPASLELLGSPWVRGLAESLCGPGCMSTYKALITKHRIGGEFFSWHQDMTHDRASRIIVISVFLSPTSAKGDGLLVLPGTQNIVRDLPFPPEDEEKAQEQIVGLGVVPGDVTVHPRNGSCERRRAANHCIPMTCPKASTHLNGVPAFSDKPSEYKRSDSSSTLNCRIQVEYSVSNRNFGLRKPCLRLYLDQPVCV